jgi:hypothetical protein
VKIIYFGPKMSFYLHFSKKQKIDHFWLTEKAITFEQLNRFYADSGRVVKPKIEMLINHPTIV